MYQLIAELFSHPEITVVQMFHTYGLGIYILMFIEYYIESAFIVISFLPRDGIMFTLGTLSLQVIGDDIVGQIDLDLVIKTLIIAGIAGDTTSYYLGKYFGAKIVGKSYNFLGYHYTLIDTNTINKTTRFITLHGYKAFFLGRLLPVLRNVIPFVAGIINTNQKKFIFFDTLGIIFLIGFEALMGIYFGKIERVKNHISIVTGGIICCMILGPFLFSTLLGLWKRKKDLSAKL